MNLKKKIANWLVALTSLNYTKAKSTELCVDTASGFGSVLKSV